MEEGLISDLTDDGVVVDRQIAEDSDLSIGDPIVVTLTGGGQLETTIAAISSGRSRTTASALNSERVGMSM